MKIKKVDDKHMVNHTKKKAKIHTHEPKKASIKQVMWMNRMCRLSEAEELLSEMDFSDVADDIAKTEEDTQLIVSGWWVFLPQLNLQLHEGILCNWDEEEQMFMPDVAVTVVYEADADRTEYIYFEQDGMTAALYNWLNGRLSISQIEALKCEIIVPEDGE